MDIPLQVLSQGLYCPAGDFFIDAWQPVPVCFITHAHGDHAYRGHGLYIGTEHTVKLLKHRLGTDIPTLILPYGQVMKREKAFISLHPAGHILGSAQVRIEAHKTVVVISGDYKRGFDKTCQPFEVVECDIFVTESTFALPIYQWPDDSVIYRQISNWWTENASKGHPSVLCCYSLGKAQRLMSLLEGLKKIYVHGAIQPLSEIYVQAGIPLVAFDPVSAAPKGASFAEDLILAPPSALGTPWMKRFSAASTGFASGWMAARGARKRRALDRGFVFSDHADWNDLLQTIDQTKAKIVLTTHGNADTLARYLREVKNIDARELIGLKVLPEDA